MRGCEADKAAITDGGTELKNATLKPKLPLKTKGFGASVVVRLRKRQSSERSMTSKESKSYRMHKG